MMQTIWKICFHKNIHEYSNLDITVLKWITFDNSEQLWDFVKGNRKFESENVFPNFIFGYINSNGKFLKKIFINVFINFVFTIEIIYSMNQKIIHYIYEVSIDIELI